MFNNVFCCFVSNIQDKVPEVKLEIENFNTTQNKM